MNPSSDRPHAPFVYLGTGENLERTIDHPPQASSEPDFYMSQDDDGTHLEVDLPGVKACDSLVELINGMLYITGTRHFQSSQKVYQKVFCLHSEGMDLSRVRANLANGVLHVTVAKTKSPTIQVIPVTTQESASQIVHHHAASTRANEETTAEHY
jgi:HSP20 family molecular chaperone IbpA